MSAKRSRARGSKADHQLRAALLREWNSLVRHQPPAKRLAWLEAAEGLVAHGANQRKTLIAELTKLRTKLELVACSESWIEEIWERGSKYGFEHMRISRARVHYGFERFVGDLLMPTAQRGGGRPSERSTPLPAVGMEDSIDLMSKRQADHYDRPPSPSAVAIQRIGMMKGRELSAGELRLRLLRKKERKAKLVLKQRNLSQTEIEDSVTDEIENACQQLGIDTPHYR